MFQYVSLRVVRVVALRAVSSMGFTGTTSMLLVRVRFGGLVFFVEGECTGFLNIISFHYVSVIAIVFRNCRCGHRNACVCVCVLKCKWKVHI